MLSIAGGSCVESAMQVGQAQADGAPVGELDLDRPFSAGQNHGRHGVSSSNRGVADFFMGHLTITETCNM